MFCATPAYAEDPITDATVALNDGNALVIELSLDATDASLLVTSSNETVISAQQSLDVADQVVIAESQDVTDAQIAYDTQVITEITYTDTSLTATIYSDPGYNNAPPLGAGTVVGTQEIATIDFQWGGGSVLGGPSEDVQIKFEGTITAPETKEYSFYGPADDGFILKINGETIINDWYDKGGGGSISSPVLLVAGQANAFEAWYYENGGGAWVQLNWYDNGWRVVPASAFDSATVVETKDPNLLLILNNEKAELDEAIQDQTVAIANLNVAIEAYNDAVEAEGIVYSSLDAAIAAIPTLQQNLADVVEAKRLADAQAAELARIAEERRLAAIAAEEEAARLAAKAKAEADAKAKAEAEALAAEQARLAEEARIAAEKAAADAAEALAKAEEEARLAAEAAAQAEADRIAAEEAAKKEQIVEPTIPPTEEPTPEPTPSEEPTQEPEKAEPESVREPEQVPATEIAAAQLEERAAQNDTGVMPYTLADAVAEVQAEQVMAVLADPGAMAEAVGESVAAAAEFVGELLTDPAATISAVADAVSQAGLDMSEDQREKAQEVIIPVVIVSQIASVIVGRIK